jgi:hypothetical protein
MTDIHTLSRLGVRFPPEHLIQPYSEPGQVIFLSMVPSITVKLHLGIVYHSDKLQPGKVTGLPVQLICTSHRSESCEVKSTLNCNPKVALSTMPRYR